MRGSIDWRMLGLASLLGMAPGCGYDLFGPPAPPPSAQDSGPTEAPRTIFMVTTVAPDSEPEGWVLTAQREANQSRAPFRSLGPVSGQGPEVEADLVRRAVADGASALIVVASEAPGLARALDEAESKKVPVVVVGRPVAGGGDPSRFTLVAPGSSQDYADRLVKVTLDDAKGAGFPGDGPALVLLFPDHDAFAIDRAEALMGAASRAGLKPRTVRFDGEGESKSTREALRAMAQLTDPSVVLAADDASVRLVAFARETSSPRPSLFSSGFVNAQPGTPEKFKGESALVASRRDDLGRLAVRAAFERMGGEPAGRRIAPESQFLRGPSPGMVPATRTRPAMEGRPRAKDVETTPISPP